MEPGPDSHPSGGHLLGPHVVGRRIVVRRLVPGETGPTGGPAFTDLLGTCLAWTPDECVVAPEAGEPVRIPLSLIVSGKPVPPRPAVRHRVSPREAESHVAGLWPRLEVQPLGEWTLRSHPDDASRRRANSCLAMGDPSMPFAEAAAAVSAFYGARGRRPLAHVEAGSEVEGRFLAAGWEPLGDGEAEFRLASVARVRRALGAVAHDVVATGLGDAAQVEVPGGRARAAYDRDWLGLHDLHVEAGQRRRGIATALVAALLEWGAERGATTAWLHVETDNAPARAFYDRLGFAVHHVATYLHLP